jgi:N-acetylglucosaminyldiphosphoundecaprenol N-acetyl-beta-D-mannosaminyltransferase
VSAASRDVSGPCCGQGGNLTGLNPTGLEYPSVRILGVRVDGITFQGMLDCIEQWIIERPGERRAHQICTVNPEFVMEARRNPPFAAVLEAADLCIADGVGLLWAARRLGKPLPERVTGSDGAPLIAARAAQKGWRLFLLGAGPGVAARAAAVLAQRYPGLQVAGTHEGSPGEADAPEIIERVRAARADVLFVAYGAPKQDFWIARYGPAVGVPAMMGVGGSLDFIAGVQKRAPRWVQRINLEWLYRLVSQPWRWRRQLALPRFVWAVMREIQRR